MMHSSATANTGTIRALTSFYATALLLLVAASGCGTEPVAPKWGVGASLVFDSYSLDDTGFWKATPDSSVNYRLVATDGAMDGRTAVHVYVSTADTIYLAAKSSGDFEVLYPEVALGPLALPREWVPLPVATHRDTTFVQVDSVINLMGTEVRMTGDVRSAYAGTELLTIPSGRMFSTGRTEIRGDVGGMVGVARLGVTIRGTTYIAPSEAIVVRSDNEFEIASPIGEPMRFGKSLRLKEAVYPI